MNIIVCCKGLPVVSYVWAVRDLYDVIFTSFYRFRYTILQVLIPTNRINTTG